MSELKNIPQLQSASIFTTFNRGIVLALTNFWRNKILSMATILVMAVILFIFNIILAVQSIANTTLQSLNEQVDILVELKNDVDIYKIKPLLNDLQQSSQIKSVKFTSKEEALEIMSRISPESIEFYRRFNLKNPFFPSLSIVLKNPSDYKKIENFLLTSKYKDLLQNNNFDENGERIKTLSSVAKNLAQLNDFVRQMIFWVIFAFVTGGTLVIMNAIQLTIYTRRQEIYIMRLVGATPGFIRFPFIFEGMLYAFLAVLISILLLFIISWSIGMEIVNPLQLSNKFVTEFILTSFLGILSSFSAVEHYLKKNLNTN